MHAALRSMAVPDYYAVLKVDADASSGQIRSAFKRLVIECHPDKNPGRRAWSETRVRELIQAYEVLGNPRTREEFDRSRRAARIRRSAVEDGAPIEPYYFHRSDPESRAMTVLYWLLEGKPETAVRLNQEMELKLGKDFLRDNLARGDYLDCLFLLGEFHLSRKEYAEAANRLRAFYHHEQNARFPRHTTGQVVDMLKDLYLRKLPRRSSAEDALVGLRDAARLGLSRAEEALRIARLIEVLAGLGRLAEARNTLSLASERLGPGRELDRLRRIVESAERRAVSAAASRLRES